MSKLPVIPLLAALAVLPAASPASALQPTSRYCNVDEVCIYWNAAGTQCLLCVPRPRFNKPPSAPMDMDRRND